MEKQSKRDGKRRNDQPAGAVAQPMKAKTSPRGGAPTPNHRTPQSV